MNPGIIVSETDRWLSEYGNSHAQISNPGIYWLSVPLLVLATVGMLWSLPVPAEFARISPLLNWGSAFLMAAVVYYFIIATSLAIGMLPFTLALTTLAWWLDHAGHPLELIAALALLMGVAGLVLARGGQGGAQAVMSDIQLMMIGPVWQLSRLYRRLGIPF